LGKEIGERERGRGGQVKDLKAHFGIKKRKRNLRTSRVRGGIIKKDRRKKKKKKELYKERKKGNLKKGVGYLVKQSS